MSRYQTIKAALITVLNGMILDALPPWLGYTPWSINPPAGFVLFGGFTRATAGQVTATTYTLIARIAIQWQQNDTAELELDPFINAVPAAIDAAIAADPSLGGVISGITQVTDATGGYWDVNKVRFRVCDFTITVLDKLPYHTPGN